MERDESGGGMDSSGSNEWEAGDGGWSAVLVERQGEEGRRTITHTQTRQCNDIRKHTKAIQKSSKHMDDQQHIEYTHGSRRSKSE